MLETERRCAVCNKKCFTTPLWVYRCGETWFCSFHCKTAFENKKSENARHSSTYKLAGKKDEVMRLIKSGENMHRIAERFGVSYNTIKYYRDRCGGLDDEENYAI